MIMLMFCRYVSFNSKSSQSFLLECYQRFRSTHYDKDEYLHHRFLFILCFHRINIPLFILDKGPALLNELASLAFTTLLDIQLCTLHPLPANFVTTPEFRA